LLTRAAERAPRWPYPVYDRAFTYLLMKDFDSALSDYRRTLELAPAWQKFADLATDTAARLDTIEKGLAADPDRGTKGLLLLNKALVLNGSGNQEAAVHVLSELVANPDSTLATEALARVILQQIAAT
jgi:predicted Zn-dependent protease